MRENTLAASSPAAQDRRPMMATMRNLTTGPRDSGRRCTPPPRARRTSRSRQNARQEKHVAARKTAPGIFLSDAPKTHLENLPQVSETHQENSVFFCTIALGCAAAPNNAEKDKKCAELARQLQYASHVRDVNKKDLSPGGDYGDITKNVLGWTDGAGLSFSGGSLTLTGGALRYAARAALDGKAGPYGMTYYSNLKPSTAHNMGVAGNYLTIGAAVIDGYNLVNSADLVDVGWNGSNLIADVGSLAIPPAAVLIGSVQFGLNASLNAYKGKLALENYYKRVETAGMLMQGLSNANNKIDQIKAQRADLGCK